MKYAFPKALIEKYRLMPQTLKASFLFTLCGIAQKVVAFVFVPIYTRIMPATDYGEYSVFLSWFQLITIFTTLNMWNYLINNGMIDFADKKWDFVASLQGLSTLITIVWFLIYIPLSNSWESWTGLAFPSMLLMFLELLFMPSFEYWCSVKRFEYKAGGVVALTIIQSVLMPALTIPMVLLTQQKGFAAISGRVIAYTIPYIVGAFLLIRKSKHWYDAGMWKYALKFTIPLVPHFLSMMVLQQSDRIMIERMCGKAEAAMYSVAYQASMTLMIVNSAVLNVLIPYIYKGINGGKNDEIKKRVMPILLLIGILNLTGALFAPEIIAILAPSEYKQAIYIIPPVMMSNLFMFLFNLFATIEYYFKQTMLVAIASFISAVVNVALNYVYIGRYGFIAAGYTTMVCYLLFSIFHFIFMKRTCRKFLDGREVYDNKKLWVSVGVIDILALLIIPLYRRECLFFRYLIIGVIAVVIVIKRKRILVKMEESLK